MRIGNPTLVFKVGTDSDGNVVCIQAMAGHPLFIGAAIESIKTWKFRPPTINKQRRTIAGTLVIRLSAAANGLRTEVLNAEPRKTQ